MASRAKWLIDNRGDSLASRFDAIVFDKDGTLLDFSKTWDAAIAQAIEASAPDDRAKQDAIASTLGFDLEERTCLVDAPVVHRSNTELAAMLAPLTDGERLIERCGTFVLEHVTAVPSADDLLRALRDFNIAAAVATNDDEVSARAQLTALGWWPPEERDGARPALVQAVLACDSGHGSKPEPGMLLAAAAALGVRPERCAMVGDAAGDLTAARSAGFGAAILVGAPSHVKQHARLADYWIEDVGELLLPIFGHP